MAKSFLGQTDLPKGIRNNNPGNLIRTGIQWEGKIPHSKSTDLQFEQFINIEYGLRALMRDIISDHTRGLNTISKLIHEYAPPFENATQSYISMVSSSLGINSMEAFSLTKQNLIILCKSICVMENGQIARTIITDSDYEAAYRILGKNLPGSKSSSSIIMLGVSMLLLTPFFFIK